MTTYIKILRHTGIKKECKDGYKHNLGNHTPGTKWSEMDYMFTTWLRGHVGETFGYKEFQQIYIGLLLASRFPLGYAKTMASKAHLENGPEYGGFIKIVNTQPVVMSAVESQVA